MTDDLDRIKTALSHHLTPSADPCQDRGIYWPCDVAEALGYEADDDTGETNVIECNRPEHQDGHHGPGCFPGAYDDVERTED